MPGSDFGVWLHEGVVLIGPGYSNWEEITCGTNQPFSSSSVTPTRCGNKLGRGGRTAVLYGCVPGIMDLWGQGTALQKCSPNS